MRLKLLSHYLYLFGGFLFGLSVADITGLKFSTWWSLGILLASAALLIAGYFALRNARRQYQMQLKQEAIDRAIIQQQEEDEIQTNPQPQSIHDGNTTNKTSEVGGGYPCVNAEP